MLLGIDAAYPPTQAQATSAKSLGYTWCGFYPNGKDGDEDPFNTWAISDLQALRNAGIVPVPIFVPDGNLASDPTDAATEWLATCKGYGLSPSVSILYDGNHLTSSGEIVGPVWLPIWGPQPSSVGPQSAIQFGSRNINGWTVDTSISATNYPYPRGIVVDFEASTQGGTTGIAWYRTFQSVIAGLTNTPLPVSPRRKQKMFIVSCAGGEWLIGADNSRVSLNGPTNGGNVAAALGITIVYPVSQDQLNEWPVKTTA